MDIVYRMSVIFSLVALCSRGLLAEPEEFLILKRAWMDYFLESNLEKITALKFKILVLVICLIHAHLNFAFWAGKERAWFDPFLSLFHISSF